MMNDAVLSKSLLEKGSAFEDAPAANQINNLNLLFNNLYQLAVNFDEI